MASQACKIWFVEYGPEGIEIKGIIYQTMWAMYYVVWKGWNGHNNGMWNNTYIHTYICWLNTLDVGTTNPSQSYGKADMPLDLVKGSVVQVDSPARVQTRSLQRTTKTLHMYGFSDMQQYTFVTWRDDYWIMRYYESCIHGSWCESLSCTIACMYSLSIAPLHLLECTRCATNSLGSTERWWLDIERTRRAADVTMIHSPYIASSVLGAQHGRF